MEGKDFKADPNIFKDLYDGLIEKVKLEVIDAFEKILSEKSQFEK